MEEEKNKLISLNELAKKNKMNKSHLSYYVSLGLLLPETVVGRMQIFDERKAINVLKQINQWQKKGLGLKEIKEKLDKN